MYTRFEIKKCVVSLLLAAALLLPLTAFADAPEIPDFGWAAVVMLNGNIPDFSPEELAAGSFLEYSELDELGRPGPASACLGRASFPRELRAENGDCLPVGWRIVRYDDVIDGGYLYSLCHLISPELCGSGSDQRNLFTGTRFLRLEGMRPLEEMIESFVSRTAYHVLYRVTPHYHGEELVPFGVQMEAYSLEDAGKNICFNVFVYNIQPGVTIDYSSGDSRLQANPSGVFVTAKELIGAKWSSALYAKIPSGGSSGASYTGGGGAAGSSSGMPLEDEEMLNPNNDDKITEGVSSFLDMAGFSGNQFINSIQYDDDAYWASVYGTDDSGN